MAASRKFTVLGDRSLRERALATLGWVQKEVGTESWGWALELCCAHYLSTDPELSTPRRAKRYPGNTPIRCRLYPDQERVVDAAFARAKDEVGLDDDTAALHHIITTFRRTFLRPHRAQR